MQSLEFFVRDENDKAILFGRSFSCANVSAYPFFGFTTAPKTPFSVATIAESVGFVFLLIFLLASYSCINGKIIDFIHLSKLSLKITNFSKGIKYLYQICTTVHHSSHLLQIHSSKPYFIIH